MSLLHSGERLAEAVSQPPGGALATLSGVHPFHEDAAPLLPLHFFLLALIGMVGLQDTSAGVSPSSEGGTLATQPTAATARGGCWRRLRSGINCSATIGTAVIGWIAFPVLHSALHRTPWLVAVAAVFHAMALATGPRSAP
jgi:hypothetical protein